MNQSASSRFVNLVTNGMLQNAVVNLFVLNNDAHQERYGIMSDVLVFVSRELVALLIRFGMIPLAGVTAELDVYIQKCSILLTVLAFVPGNRSVKPVRSGTIINASVSAMLLPLPASPPNRST